MCIKEHEIIKNNLSKLFPHQVYDYGKMIRSKLGLLVLKSVDIEVTSSYIDLLTAVELIHNASLYHDDVIDNEIIRRSPLVDNKTAVLYGNILLTNAISVLANLNNFSIITLFNNTIKNMCEGELMQKSQIGRVPSKEDYIKKTFLKTALLFRTMVEGLNIISGNVIDNNIIKFAELYGISFQIKNDLKNVLENKSDLKSGIYTAPFVLTNSTVLTKDGIEKTLILIDNYTSEAENCLNILNESSYKDLLIREIRCLKN